MVTTLHADAATFTPPPRGCIPFPDNIATSRSLKRFWYADFDEVWAARQFANTSSHIRLKYAKLGVTSGIRGVLVSLITIVDRSKGFGGEILTFDTMMMEFLWREGILRRNLSLFFKLKVFQKYAKSKIWYFFPFFFCSKKIDGL